MPPSPRINASDKKGRELLSMADNVERNVKRVATGWEEEPRIAIGDLIPGERVLDLCAAFDEIAPETRLRLSAEVLGGNWDALASGRVDFVMAPGDSPGGVGYAQHPLGEVEFVFVVSPQPPLSTAEEPLSNDLIRHYCAVAAADSSRGLAPRTVDLLPGQNVLTVPDTELKRLAQAKGLGVGYMPVHLVADDISAGRLIVKATEDSLSTRHTLYYAWRSTHQGKALVWFRRRLCNRDTPYNWFDH